MEYSYILDNLKEPKLSKDLGKRVLRFIIPKETSGTTRDYYSIRINFSNAKMVYKMGEFDSNLNYQLTKSDSALLNAKQIRKIESRINLFNFRGVDFFTEVGLDIYPKYLIEYYDGSNYYIFEKQLFSRNKKDKELNKLLFEILMIKDKEIKDN